MREIRPEAEAEREQVEERVEELRQEGVLPDLREDDELAPPDTGSDRDFAAIGASSEDIRAFALGGLTRRLEIIGVPLASL